MAKELMPGQKRLTTGSVLADIGVVAWFVFARLIFARELSRTRTGEGRLFLIRF